MERLVFRLERTLRNAHRIPAGDGVRLSLPGVQFSGLISDADEAVVGLVIRAISGKRMHGYWRGDECCEACVQNGQEPLSYVTAVFRLAKEAVTSDETAPVTVLMNASVEGLDEYRRYIRRVVPNRERATPWGEGEREEYLDAMHGIRHHLLGVITQLHRLTRGSVQLPEDVPTRDAWDLKRYTRPGAGSDLFDPRH